MAITKLDPVAALVVIDLQKGITGMATVHPMAEIIGRTAKLARAFRKRGLPVVLVNATGRAPGRTEEVRPNFVLPADWMELVPELEQQASDCTISKQRWGAFIGTTLHEELQKSGVTQIFLTGVATGAGVESTARSAYDYGYNVALVVDAMTDRDAETHRHCVENVFPRVGETDTTERVLKVMQ